MEQRAKTGDMRYLRIIFKTSDTAGFEAIQEVADAASFELGKRVKSRNDPENAGNRIEAQLAFGAVCRTNSNEKQEAYIDITTDTSDRSLEVFLRTLERDQKDPRINRSLQRQAVLPHGAEIKAHRFCDKKGERISVFNSISEKDGPAIIAVCHNVTVHSIREHLKL